jgi:VIT1/CCC1 family predicted Fe2+/Mn2+ transporter
MRHVRFPTEARLHSRSFLLQRAQPALSGLMDGSLSTLAPIFAVVLATHRPLTAFYTGLATALGAGVSMAFSEGLSDTGDLTGRGRPILRGSITGGGTFLGGVFHTLPFLIANYHVAIVVAIVVVGVELVLLAWLRFVFFETGFLRSLIFIAGGGTLIAALSAALGAAASGS